MSGREVRSERVRDRRVHRSAFGNFLSRRPQHSTISTSNDSTNILVMHARINVPFNERRVYFNQPYPTLQLVEPSGPCVELVCTALVPGHIFVLSSRMLRVEMLRTPARKLVVNWPFRDTHSPPQQLNLLNNQTFTPSNIQTILL